VKRVFIVTLALAVLLGMTSDSLGCSGDYGLEIGSYRGVPAYSNGNSWDCTGTGSGTYQCVEYVKRFYSAAMYFNTSGLSGNANVYFGSAVSKGLRVFNQNGTVKP
jgi:hypothetical protein